MPQALKASWEVRAGVIPQQPVRELTKRWHYTSQEHAQDEGGNGPEYHAVFSKLRAEAMDYYLQMMNPNLNNWAEVTFIWY